MFEFTANFKDNDIYLDGKYAFKTNEVLVEILNIEVPNFKDYKLKLNRELSEVELIPMMETWQIEKYNSHIQAVQKVFTSIDMFFDKLSISKFIADSGKIHAEKLIDLLNTKSWLWETDESDNEELLCSKDYQNEYGFNYYDDKYDDGRQTFYITKFEPWCLKDGFLDNELPLDLESLNTKIKKLFDNYITFIDDILRVKEVYVDFIDNYLNKDHKFLASETLAKYFTEFLKKYNDHDSSSHLSFTSGYGRFSHSVITDKKGKAVLCKTFHFKSLGAFLYYDLFNGIETNYLPKKCENCGKYFLIASGKYTDYCEDTSPQDKTKTCREVGARKRYDEKCKNDPVWQGYNRAYKAHYARYMKKKMTVSEFEKWASWAIEWRTKAENDEITMEEYLMEIRK